MTRATQSLLIYIIQYDNCNVNNIRYNVDFLYNIMYNYIRGGNMSTEFYDGNKLLSLPDINGNKPEIIVCCSNRSAGKTTFFNRYLVKRFLNTGEKFGVLFRYKNELQDCANKFFNDVGAMFFPEYTMTARYIASGYLCELLLQKADETPVPCGYCFALNSADKLKKFSHLLSDVEQYVFDEFQTETNRYLPNEIDKFVSLHTSIARGGGKQSRFVRVILLSNNITLLNPYFVSWGISAKMTKQKFTRGNGWVVEFNYNENAAKAQKQSIFNQAFQSAAYVVTNSETVYLNDNFDLIETPSGKSSYIATLKYDNYNIGLYEFAEIGVIYASRSVNPSRLTIPCWLSDVGLNKLVLKKYDNVIRLLREYFISGCFRFSDLEVKTAIINILGYR